MRTKTKLAFLLVCTISLVASDKFYEYVLKPELYYVADLPTGTVSTGTSVVDAAVDAADMLNGLATIAK
jgi:hypothetical protein